MVIGISWGGGRISRVTDILGFLIVRQLDYWDADESFGMLVQSLYLMGILLIVKLTS